MQATIEAAVVAHNAGRLQEAEASYREILAREPKHPAALNNLGMIALTAGHLGDAVRLIGQAFANAPDDPGLHPSARALGLALFHQGFRIDARPWLERAAQAAPDDAEVAAALERSVLPAHCAPSVADPSGGPAWRRYPPYESANYVYSIDIVGTCNLRCPTCPVENMRDEPRPKGLMSVELFRSIIDKIRAEAPGASPEIWLFNWGEPLLHPKLAEIVALVRERGMSVHLSTNLNIRRGLESAVRAAPDSIKVSMSGLSSTGTYGQTHAGGDVNLVKSNLHLLRYLLDRHRVATRVWVGFHLYRSNLQEAAVVRALCDELRFEYRENPAVLHPVEKVVEFIEGRARPEDVATVDRLLTHPLAILEQVKAKRTGHFDCELRFNMTTINHDGTVALCCATYGTESQLGVRFLDEPHEALEARKYAHPFCATCYGHGLQYTTAKLPD
ncbi:MAG: tetratricopeptide repeat protein [Burkholderiales bacterium]